MNQRGPVRQGGVILTVVAMCWLPICPAARAQLSSASVNGTVRDSTGAVIPGANITLLETSTATARTTESNSDGNYAFVDVAPGNYTLEVVKQGFSTAKQNAFVLYVNQTATFNFSLT